MNSQLTSVKPSSGWEWNVDKTGWGKYVSGELQNWLPSWKAERQAVEEFKSILHKGLTERPQNFYDPSIRSILDPGVDNKLFWDLYLLINTSKCLTVNSFSFTITREAIVWWNETWYRFKKGTFESNSLPVPEDNAEKCMRLADWEYDNDCGVENFLKYIFWGERNLPNFFSWAKETTKVITPVPVKNQHGFNSSSDALVPGQIKISNNCSLFHFNESIAHETAHLNLFLSENNNILIDPGHTNNIYSSPLRKDKRPLRGILLAFHALVYIQNYYKALLEVVPQDHKEEIYRELKDLSRKINDAGETLERAKAHFTPAGKKFFTTTKSIIPLC